MLLLLQLFPSELQGAALLNLMLPLPTYESQSVSQPVDRSPSLSLSRLLVKGTCKLAVAGPTQQEAGPFHEDPCPVKELQLRAVGHDSCRAPQACRARMTSWTGTHGHL